MTRRLPLGRILLVGVLMAALAMLAFEPLDQAEAQSEVRLVGNTGQSYAPGRVDLSQVDVSQRFRTGSSTHGYMVTAVNLRTEKISDGAVKPTVAIYTARGDRTPLAEVGVLTAPSSLRGHRINTWTSPGIYLAPNTDYALLVDSHSSADNFLIASNSNDLDSGAAGWTISGHPNTRARDGSNWTWYISDATVLVLEVKGYALTSRPLVSNMRQSQDGVRLLNQFDLAQQFRTGAHTHGYLVESIDLLFREAGSPNMVPTVAIYTVSAGAPDTEVAVLNPPGILTANSVNRWVSPGIHLAPNTDYIVLVDSSGGANNYVRRTSSGNEDPESLPGWSIANTSRERPVAGGTWSTQNFAFHIKIDGVARASSRINPPTTPRVDSDPDSPTTLTAHWRRPFTLVNVPITRYDVRYSTDGSTWTDWTRTGTGTSETITGLTRGTAYQVQVRAVHTPAGGSDNLSAWSASGFGTPGGQASVFVLGNTSKDNEFTDNANLDDHSVFQSFCTGAATDGYRLTGVELMFLMVARGGEATVPQVTIYRRRNTEGHPGAQVGAFTRPVRLVSANNGLNLWTSPGVALDPRTCYVLGVEGDGAGHVVRNQQADANGFLLDDGGGLASWYVVDEHVKRPHGTSRYDDVSKNLKLRMFGYAFKPYAAPNFGRGSYVRSFDENTPAGTAVGLPITAEGTDTLTYSLGGADRNSFTIDGDTGQIRTRSGVTYDYESGKIRYSLTIRATDDQNQDTAQVTINLRDLDDRPPGPPWDDSYPEVCWPSTKIEPGSVTSGRLTRDCVSDYHIGWRLGAAFRQYHFDIEARTKVMLVMESELDEQRSTRDGRRHTQFDPYLILLQVRPVPGRPDIYILPYNIGEYDDIDSSVGNESAGVIRWLDAGQYVAYATSRSMGVTDVGFKLTYQHEGATPLRLPGRKSQIPYTDYSHVGKSTTTDDGGDPPDEVVDPPDEVVDPPGDDPGPPPEDETRDDEYWDDEYWHDDGCGLLTCSGSDDHDWDAEDDYWENDDDWWGSEDDSGCGWLACGSDDGWDYYYEGW